MVEQLTQDQRYMQQAINLAEQGLYTTSPNPRVGCVIVKNSRVIAEGYHVRAGEAHAEINALEAARKEGNSEELVGATVYVTLEPCSHTGKTPPCCDALIVAQVSRVVVAMIDPNPLVAGRGIEKLRAAGIEVDVGVQEAAARALNPGFIQRMETGRPLVRVKLAMSLDGRTAMASGESQWITGQPARSDVQRLRARSCAIVSGVDTVIQDDAALTVRAKELAIDPVLASLAEQKQPLRVILDSNLRLPASAKLVSQPGRTLVLFAKENTSKKEQLVAKGIDVIAAGHPSGRVDLDKLLEILAEAQCNEVLIEAGATLAGAFVEAALVDELVVYMAPTLLGSGARPLLALALDKMAQQKKLQITEVVQIGDDWRVTARFM